MQWRGNNKTAPQNDIVLAVNSACTGSAACPGWQIHIYHCNMVCFLSQRSIKILEGKQSCRGASTQLNKKGQEEHYQSHKKNYLQEAMLEFLCFWSNDEDQHQKWQIPYWCTILFTDETRFKVSSCDKRERVWRCHGYLQHQGQWDSDGLSPVPYA